MQKRERFYSLDVFRGATVALMILVNNPGSWAHIYDPLEHAAWHGCTPTDLVFPFFLFAVGNAMAFVMPGLEKAGDAAFWRKVGKRSLLIFGIGLLLHWFPFIRFSNGEYLPRTWDNLRIMGVLQRIAVCYFFASVAVYYFKLRGAFIFTAILLLGYWLLCLLGNPADPYSLSGWFGTDIDRAILGDKHMYKGEGVPFDPEGLMSSFAAIAQVIFGYFVGNYIITKGKTYEMITGLFVAGIGLVLTGFIWDMFFPINKKIWTSSYTVYTTGLATMMIATMIWFIEMRGVKNWLTRFFDVFGKNPLFIFVLSGALPRLLNLVPLKNGFTSEGKQKYQTVFNWFYETVCKPLFTDTQAASLLYALCIITMMWFIAWVLDKKKIYIKV